jgi:hypothetical protein
MVFTFSGFNLFNLMHMNRAAVIAHLPWLLLATHVLPTSPDRIPGAGVRRFRAGSRLAAATAIPSRVADGGRSRSRLLRYAERRRGSLLVGVVLGALVGAVQLLPDFARESTRMAYSQEESLSFSLSPLNLVQLWSPFAFQFRIHAPASEALIVHEFIVYNGAFCTLALAWLAMRWRQQTRRGLLIALFALAVISFLLATGRYGGVYVWLAHLPGLRSLRAPARHLILFQLALSGIAAVAFEDLVGLVRRGETIDVRRMWPLAALVAISVSTSLLAGVLSQSAWATAHGLSLSAFLRAAPWSILIAGMAVVVAMAGRGIGWSVPMLIVLVACDQGFWGYSYAFRWGPIRTIADLVANANAPPDAQRGDLIAPLIERIKTSRSERMRRRLDTPAWCPRRFSTRPSSVAAHRGRQVA